ncbi:MAG: type II toxin-antitoxin system HicA family toxin [Candidatus Firestonebacteria bacterium]|nr:type II toxin-antitoxin system HicA family toxin [Candidatus Firestonebacteria bacterium]
MKSTSGKEFVKLLEKHGWELKRINGSHHIYAKSGNPARISVPIHSNTPLKIGLLKHIMKIAGINENEL